MQAWLQLKTWQLVEAEVVEVEVVDHMVAIPLARWQRQRWHPPFEQPHTNFLEWPEVGFLWV